MWRTLPLFSSVEVLRWMGEKTFWMERGSLARTRLFVGWLLGSSLVP
jgi:hypothetical protein